MSNIEQKHSVTELLSLQGKVALVTGGAQNFGAEIASGLKEAGAQVIITSRQLEKAAAAAEAGGYDFAALDITSEESVQALFAMLKEKYGKVDSLVNNAGGHTPEATGILETEPLSAWQTFVNTNLTGTFLMLREYARLMIPQATGTIINIASISSLVGRDRTVYPAGMTPNPFAYTAAKAGVIGLTYDAAAYLGQYNIRVNAISPGGFERRQPPEFIEEYSRRTMLGRMGEGNVDLKGAVVFLASEAARYVTGHNLYVDGGFSRFK